MRRPLTDKQLVRVAGRIHDQLQAGTAARLVNLDAQLQQVAAGADHLRADRRKLHICRQRGWMGPVPRLLSRIERTGRELSYALSGLERTGQSVRRQGPSLREVHAELEQAQSEFGTLHYDRRLGELSAVTEPVELEGVYLGPFEIRLQIQSLTDPRHVPYRVVALEPHPAACNAAVTHPHVSEERLCPGDAGAAIGKALDAGRVCDVFTLVRSVLLTYNPESPYVSLDDWFGTTCYECGYVMPPDEVRWCEICGHDYCGECAGYCHRCDETTCLGCLRTCPVCEEPTCISCMTVCPDCGRDLCGLCLEETLCPCHEEEETDDDDRTTDRAANSAAEQEASATPTVQPAGDARG